MLNSPINYPIQILCSPINISQNSVKTAITISLINLLVNAKFCTSMSMLQPALLWLKPEGFSCYSAEKPASLREKRKREARSVYRDRYDSSPNEQATQVAGFARQGTVKMMDF